MILLRRLVAKPALRVSLIYLLFAGLWILLSDRLLEALVGSTEVLSRLQTFKGAAFVGVTTLMLYVLIQRSVPMPTDTSAGAPSIGVPLVICILLALTISVSGWFAHHAMQDAIPTHARHDLTLFIVLSALLLTAASSAVVWMWWQRERSRLANIELQRQLLARRYDDLSRYASDIILLTDERGRFADCNVRATEMLGYSREELLGMSLSDLREPHSDEDMLDARPDDIDMVSYHVELKRKDGALLPAEINARLVELGSGQWACHMVIRDMTARVAAERVLRTSEERFRHLLEFAPVALAVSSEDGRIIYLNRIHRALFGYTLEDIPTIGEWARKAYPDPAYRQRVFDLWNATMRQADARGIPTRGQEVQVTCRDGTVKQVILRAVRIGTETLVGFTDVTTLKRAEARLEKLNRLYAALSHTNTTIMRLGEEVEEEEEETLFQAICRIAVEDAGLKLAWIGRLDTESGWVQPVAVYGSPTNYVEGIRISIRDDLAEGRGPTGTSMREHRPVVVADFFQEGTTQPWHARAAQAGFGSSAAFPLARNGRPHAAFMAYHPEPGYFDAEVVGLLSEMSQDVEFALAMLDARRERQTLMQRLQAANTIVESSPVVLWVWRAEPGWPTDYVSENVTQFGYAAQDFLSGRLSYAAIVHPDDLERVMREVAEYAAAGASHYVQQYRIHCKDGSIRWLDDHTIVIRDAQGRIVRYQGITTDITARVQTEQELRESEERFRSLIEQSLTGAYILQDGVVAYTNPRLKEILGYPAEEDATGRDPLEIVAEKDRARVAQHLQDLIQGTATSPNIVFTALRKDGSTVEVGVNSTRATYHGRLAIIGLMQDITERKVAEEQIRHYTERLQTAFMQTVGLATTLSEMRDPYTAGHERRVAEIAVAIGAEMGLDEQRLIGLRVGGYLHDVGKTAIPIEILTKPGRITPTEYELIKAHPQAGYDVLKDVDFPWPVAQIALQHHERMDGSGYPQGLKGDQILLEARITAVADVFESMASHRPYRPALGVDQALAELERGRGTFYDSEVVDALLRLVREKGYAMPA